MSGRLASPRCTLNRGPRRRRSPATTYLHSSLPFGALTIEQGWFCGQGLCSGRRPVFAGPVLGNRLALGRTGCWSIVSGPRSTFTHGRPPAPGGRHQSACFQYAGRPANSKNRCRGRYRLARLLQSPQLLKTLAVSKEKVI